MLRTSTLIEPARALRAALTLPGFLTGLLIVIVGTASSLVIVFQAATRAGLSEAQVSSWVLAIMLGCAFSSILMSLWFRQPAIAAWSTPGAALLVTSLGHYTYGEAVGAYIIAALLTAALGLSGLFGWVMARVPQPVVLGMLGGVLIKFGFGLFNTLPQAPVMVILMMLAFFLLRRAEFRAPTVGALGVGLVLAALAGSIQTGDLRPALAVPVWTPPVFSLEALLGLALPLCALALTSQYAPGQAVLRAAGYEPPINRVLVITSLASLVTAPFGGHGITLAAITAAMATGPETHPDPAKRFAVGVATGFWYLGLGVFGATLVSLFTALPAALIAATAGLGLSPAIIGALSGAMKEAHGREGALIALLCTAADFSLLGIGAPFWGLVFGIATHAVIYWRRGA